jgi:hypothetical protein
MPTTDIDGTDSVTCIAIAYSFIRLPDGNKAKQSGTIISPDPLFSGSDESNLLLRTVIVRKDK